MEHIFPDSDQMRTEYSPVNFDDEYQPMVHLPLSQQCRCACKRRCTTTTSSQSQLQSQKKVATRNIQQCNNTSDEAAATAALNTHHRHHQLCDVQRLEAKSHSSREGHTTTTTEHHQHHHHHRDTRQGILSSVSGHCLRQLTLNLSGTYSVYQWSTICLLIHVLIFSLNWSSCTAYHTHRNPTQERIPPSIADDPQTNGNFHRVDEYLRFLYPQNDTNRMWSKLVRNSPYLTRGKKRSGRAGTKDRTFSSSEGMKRINAEREAAECQPRDTVLDSYEELGVAKGYSTFIFPDCVVVKRCKHGGCCRDDEECVPAEHAREEVSMLFLINQDPIEQTIIQDTACECRPKPAFCPPPQADCSNGKVWSYSECKCTCRYRCPKPFLQDEDSCACDCLMSNRDCKNVSRGRRNRKLAPEECDCVRRGLCATPPCVNGRFSISACKCVQMGQSWS